MTFIPNIRQNLTLRPNYIVRSLYLKVPFPLKFRLYVFDLLNKEEFMNGEKPRFKEIGPYVFE